MEKPSREELVKHILKSDPNENPESESFRAQLVMLMSASHGTMDVKKLAKLTGVPHSLVWKFAHNLRKNGVWHGRKICANWLDKENGGTAFMLDVCVATGLMARAT
jgi:hypothetical protein